MKKISILLKVNGAAWRKKFIEFDEGNISLDFNDWISPRHIHIFIVPLFLTLVSITLISKRWFPHKKSFDIVDSATLCRDYRIEKSSFLSLQCLSTQNHLLLSACLLQDSGHRKLQNFKIEFHDSEQQKLFLEYLKKNKFLLESQRKKFLVFINPVSGKGKAKESKV